jgi:hypothetical protein
MKRRGAGLTFGLGLLLLFRVPIGLAEQSGVRDSGKWMLEIVQANQAPKYLQMPEGRSEDQGDYTFIPVEADSATSGIQPSGLEFRYWMQGAAVRVRVALTFDPSESRSSSDEELPVENYVIHPGESITVSQLSHFGFRPVQVKMVTAKPPGAIQPEIVNETSSMVVENVDQDRAEYKLFLSNTSELAVDGIVASVFDGEGRCRMHNQRTHYGHFIAPHSTREIELSLPVAGEDEGVVGADGKSCSNAAQDLSELSPGTRSGGARFPEIVIEAVDFEDGSYEGDAQKAAMLEADRLGRKLGRLRITAVVEHELTSTQPDGMTKLVSVQSQVTALSDNVDPAALDSIMAQFPTVRDSAKESLERDIHEGLLWEKDTFLRNLRLYVFELSSGSAWSASDASLRRWWDVTKGRCDFLVPQTCPNSD